MRTWAKAFFREPVFTPGMSEALAAAPAEAAFLWRALKLKKGARVLDVCCGTGRHAALLSRRGADVVGVDLTPSYLTQARRAAPGARFLRADMRRLPFKAEFDAAYNVWTSFGYFEKPADDLRALVAARRALKPGGLFVVDVMDFAWLRKHFQPRQWSRRADGAQRLESSKLREGRDPAILSEWTILAPGKPAARASLFVRGYDEARLSALLRRAGLAPLKRWFGFSAARSGNRLVILSRAG